MDNNEKSKKCICSMEPHSLNSSLMEMNGQLNESRENILDFLKILLLVLAKWILVGRTGISAITLKLK